MKKLFMGIIVLIIFFILIPLNIQAATPDTEGPKLTSFKIAEEKTYNPGDKVEIDINAKDDISGIQWVSILFFSEKNHFYVNLQDIEGNPYIEIPKTALGDTYYIENIDLCDNSGNQNRYARVNSDGIYTDVLLKVERNENNKEFNPTIKNVKFENDVVKSGEIQKVTIDLEDKYEPWIAGNYVRITNKSKTFDIPLYYNEDTKKLEGAININSSTSNYFIDHIGLENSSRKSKTIHYLTKYSSDNLKHFCTTEPSEWNCINEEIGFKVENEVEDNDAPKLVNVKFGQKKVTAPSIVKVYVDVTDASEIKVPRVMIKRIDDEGNPDDNSKKSINLYYDEITGLYTGVVDFNQYTKSGKYYINEVFLEDKNSNAKSYCLNNEYDNAFYNLCSSRNAKVDMNNIKLDYIEIVDEFAYDLVLSLNDKELVNKIKEAKDDAVIMIDAIKNSIVKKEVFEAIQNTNKTIYFESNGIQWVFKGKDIVNELKDIDISLKTSIMYDENIDNSDKRYVSLEFADNGLLPGKALVRINSNYTYRYESGLDALQVYYSADGKYYKIAEDIRITEDGFYEFTITHNSVYILSNKDIPKEYVIEEKPEELLTEEEKVAEKEKKEQKKNSTTVPYIIIAIVIIVIICVYATRKTKKEEKDDK